MTCNNPKYKMYTGLSEQFEYCDSCGEKKTAHNKLNTAGYDPHINYADLQLSINELASKVLPPKAASMYVSYTNPNLKSEIYNLAKHASITLAEVRGYKQKVSTNSAISVSFLVPESNSQVSNPLELWLPALGASNPLLYGVDRSIDPLRLAGLSWGFQPGYSYQEMVTIAAMLVAREGGKADALLLSPGMHNKLIREMSKQSLYAPRQGLKVNTSYGEITVHEDPILAKDTGHLVTLDSWSQTQEFGVVCHSPGYNCRITF